MSKRKAIFDFVRMAMGRGFTAGEVSRLDTILTEAGVPESHVTPDAPTPAERSGRLTVSASGVDMIHRWEGCAKKLSNGMIRAYPDPGTGGKPWTIGYGSTRNLDGSAIQPGTEMTLAEVKKLGRHDVDRHAEDVRRFLRDAPTSQAQFDALVSFHYNTGALPRSTLGRKHKAGDFAGAYREFARWNKAGGRVMRGLTRRRTEEATLYRKGS